MARDGTYYGHWCHPSQAEFYNLWRDDNDCNVHKGWFPKVPSLTPFSTKTTFLTANLQLVKPKPNQLDKYHVGGYNALQWASKSYKRKRWKLFFKSRTPCLRAMHPISFDQPVLGAELCTEKCKFANFCAKRFDAIARLGENSVMPRPPTSPYRLR